MSICNMRKTVTPGVLDCGGRATVTISFDADQCCGDSPGDVVLVMDRSGSMCGPALSTAQRAAGELVEILSGATGDPTGKALLRGSRLGLVSFAGEARQETGLETHTAPIHQAIASLRACGETNQELAFLEAERMLKCSRADRKIIVLFTDGNPNRGCADPVARRLRQAGVEIFCIGLLKCPEILKRWASSPSCTHVASAAEPCSLCRVFREIAARMVKNTLEDVCILETLTEDFRIEHIEQVTHGEAALLNGRSLCWKVGTVCAGDSVCLTFRIRHVGGEAGLRPVNDCLCYEDSQGNHPCFPSPCVEVRRGSCIIVDPCGEGVDGCLEPCQCLGEICAGQIPITGQGRIVRVNATLKNVCPGKRVALAVVLTELGECGAEYARGMKTLLIPAQPGEECRDIQVDCIQFILPEALKEGCGEGLCSRRCFRARVSANYVDTDFQCCEAETVIL